MSFSILIWYFDAPELNIHISTKGFDACDMLDYSFGCASPNNKNTAILLAPYSTDLYFNASFRLVP